jgi:hypothetical protein
MQHVKDKRRGEGLKLSGFVNAPRGENGLDGGLFVG